MANPTDPSNSNLIAQAQGTTGTGTSTPVPTPVNDISQIPSGASMYGSGGVGTTTYGQGRGKPAAGEGPGYSGIGPYQNTPQGYTTQGTTVTSPTQTQTVEQWLNTFYTTISSDPNLMTQFSTEAQLAGLTGPNANVAQLYSAWQKLIVQAYNHDINGQNLTPWDVLANSIPGVNSGTYKSNAGYQAMTSMTSQQAADIAAKAAAKNKDVTTQSTTTDINYTDPDTARFVLNQASQTLLGRQATNAEVSSFTKQLNSNEAMFPKMTQDTKSTQTGTDTTTTPGTGTSDLGTQGQTVVGYDSAGNPIMGPTGSTTNTSTSGNSTDTVVSLGEADYTRYGREQLAQDAAKAAPDYGAFQAAGPYMQAFLGTLKGAVQGVGSNG
jgi:hypothetical protein